MDDETESRLLTLCDRVVEMARARGADVAEASARQGWNLSARVRLGEPELVEEAGSRAVGLRAMVGSAGARQVGLTYSSDVSNVGLERLVGDAIELARLSQPDEHADPPDPSELGTADAALDLYDPRGGGVKAEEAIERARAGEHAARVYDPRITNSEGATFARVAGASAFVTSGGFRGAYRGSYQSLTVSPVADDADGKKRSGYWWTANRWLDRLEPEKRVGEEAARRTLAKLGARKVETCEVPVVFEAEVARSLLALFAGCISGGAIWRRSSYLLEREGTKVASELVHVVDDPLLPKAPGSRPFDGDGLPSRRNEIIEAGVLRTYLLDTYSARKLGRKSTGSASRAVGGGPGAGTTNLVMSPGTSRPEEIVASTKKGLYVTDMMGFGFNAVTGDFSRGASGFWIENGEKTFPVSEITISLNLDQLLQRIDAIGDTVELRSSIACPMLRVSAMTIAGK